MKDILKEICEYKKEIVIRDSREISFEKMRQLASEIKTKSNFTNNLKERIDNNQTAIIAEIKKKSPSQGLIRDDFNVKEIATNYKEGGATCISVLTDEKYFAGSNEYVKIAKEASNLPILRKDFIIDEYQIYQAKQLGADAILLIMACLSKEQAKEYEEIANSIGLDVLVESFNEDELVDSLELKTPLVGVNNRNLKTLNTSLDNIKNLKAMVSNDRILVCESGINKLEDFQEIKKLEINCFLIGGYFMAQKNIKESLMSFLKI